MIFFVLIFCLTACTGSFESLPSTLLLVGFNEAGIGKLGLIDAELVRGNDTNITLIENSPRTLDDDGTQRGDIQSVDIVDRRGNRSELVVLSRTASDGSSTSNQIFISFFKIENIVAGNPINFALDRSLLINDLDTELNFCAQEIQVSLDGRYVAVSHDFELCNSGEETAIDIIDLESDPPEILERIQPTGGINPNAFFMLQGSSTRLFYLENSTNFAILNAVTIPSLEKDSEPPNIEETNPDDIVDMAQFDNSSLIALVNNRFLLINSFITAPEVQAPVDSESNSQGLVHNDRFVGDEVSILTSNRLVIHKDISDSEPLFASSSARDASITPNEFIYLLSDSQIAVSDLISFRLNESVSITGKSVDELVGNIEAAFITWVFAAFEETTP